jgi:hypothetical protein
MEYARAESSYTQRVLAHLRAWPTVSAAEAECGSGLALWAGGGEIAHRHADDEAEVRLRTDVVERMSKALDHTGRVRLGSDTVRLRVQNESDLRLLLSLLSVAIKSRTDARNDGNGPWCRIGSAMLT